MSKPIFTIESIQLDGTRDTFEGQPATAAGYSVELTSDGLFIGMKNHAVNQHGDLMMTAAEPISLFAPANDPLLGVLFQMFKDKIMEEYGGIISNIAAGPYPEEFWKAWAVLKKAVNENAANPSAIFPAALDHMEQLVIEGNIHGPIFRAVCPLVLVKEMFSKLNADPVIAKAITIGMLTQRNDAMIAPKANADQVLADAQVALADAVAHNANPPELTPAVPAVDAVAEVIADPEANPPIEGVPAIIAVPAIDATYEPPIVLIPLQAVVDAALVALIPINIKIDERTNILTIASAS